MRRMFLVVLPVSIMGCITAAPPCPEKQMVFLDDAGLTREVRRLIPNGTSHAAAQQLLERYGFRSGLQSSFHACLHAWLPDCDASYVLQETLPSGVARQMTVKVWLDKEDRVSSVSVETTHSNPRREASESSL